MSEKAANLGDVLGPNPITVQWWFKILMMGVFLGILIVWGIDSSNMETFRKDYLVLKINSSEFLPIPLKDSTFSNLSTEPQMENSHQFDPKIIAPHPHNLVLNQTLDNSLFTPQVPEKSTNARNTKPWISSELEPDYSSSLLARWLTPGGQPCKDSRTVDIRVPRFDRNDNKIVELPTDEIHEFVFQALDETGEPHCLGVDYFETDLSGERWKSRPPIKDMGNGTYTFALQVHAHFSGDYNLTVILLYRHYEGLKFSPARFAFDRVLRVIPIKFVESVSHLPEIRQCKWSDYTKDVWSGRWTRHAKNYSCAISNDGRYRCQEPDFPCENPWCDGPLGLLESNGWVYSTHCSFKLLSSQEAWNCLDNRWIFWWGDSNHCDTIRNILHFILDVHEIPSVSRIFDMNITNPRDRSQTVRFTSIFNGHPNSTGNYQVPDTVIMNSGLHDGVYWSNIRNFIKGADYAASFWAEVMDGLGKNGLLRPKVIYRTTVATGGYARRMAFNPHKMEAFNGVMLDKLRKYGVVDGVIDGFDMTYPWHYDNRCNDGVHYGRAPVKMKWRDGLVGHQYFVDLMLGHVLMNALCRKRVVFIVRDEISLGISWAHD
ncbi:hypothetical protein OROHE_003166 [Orobanche hederae]